MSLLDVRCGVGILRCRETEGKAGVMVRTVVRRMQVVDYEAGDGGRNARRKLIIWEGVRAAVSLQERRLSFRAPPVLRQRSVAESILHQPWSLVANIAIARE